MLYSHVAVCFFFFFKQKTAYELRISDWSSDVCSSDLAHRGEHRRKPAADDEANRIGGKMGLERSVEIEAPAEIDIVDVGVDDRSASHLEFDRHRLVGDRKSTRLNSSH